MRMLSLAVLALSSCASPQAAPGPSTTVSLRGDAFLINGIRTYAGRPALSGLLLNARLVQATFDDLNPATATRWAYPDTHTWDAERNTREFLETLPEWRRHGLLAFTLNLQGGSPEGYSQKQPWLNSAFTDTGDLIPAYLDRFDRILDRADELGMVVILGLFYFGQDERLKDESAVIRGVDRTIAWLLAKGRRHVIIEVNNECNVRYDHAILRPDRVHELILRVRKSGLLAGTSYGGGVIPKENVVRASDFLLLHGNGVKEPRKIADMVRNTRAVPGYRPMPILFNEDDHFDFEKPENNFRAALSERAGWGYFDPEGFQSPPVRWTIDTPRKKAFFQTLRDLTGS